MLMDRFKATTGIEKVFPIDEENFLKITGKREPYCRIRAGGKESLYAVCPACDNPIQIIGLFRDTPEAGRKPYGKHNKGSIFGLAEYDENEYLECPYSNPNKHNRGEYRRPESKVANQILELLRTQLDRVVYVLSKEIDIKFSDATVETMLRRYLANEGWRYRVATIYNLPWVFGYAEKAVSLFGRRIIQNSNLHKALEANCPNVCFDGKPEDECVQVKSKPGTFLDVNYTFLAYKQNRRVDGQDEEAINETVDFRVYSGRAPRIKTIYQKTIDIDPGYFLNLIHLPEEKAKRSLKLLNLADELIK